jgi:hypothetical protein
MQWPLSIMSLWASPSTGYRPLAWLLNIPQGSLNPLSRLGLFSFFTWPIACTHCSRPICLNLRSLLVGFLPSFRQLTSPAKSLLELITSPLSCLLSYYCHILVSSYHYSQTCLSHSASSTSLIYGNILADSPLRIWPHCFARLKTSSNSLSCTQPL